MAIKLAEERHRRVSEVMSEAVGIIEESATAGEAKTILVDLEVTGAPVVRGEQVLGVVSRADLLRADDATPVTEIMSDPVYAVRPNDSLALAVRLMVKQRIHRVVVVNEAGELRGILTALDALAAVADSLGPTGDIGYASLAPPEE